MNEEEQAGEDVVWKAVDRRLWGFKRSVDGILRHWQCGTDDLSGYHCGVELHSESGQGEMLMMGNVRGAPSEEKENDENPEASAGIGVLISSMATKLRGVCMSTVVEEDRRKRKGWVKLVGLGILYIMQKIQDRGCLQDCLVCCSG